MQVIYTEPSKVVVNQLSRLSSLMLGFTEVEIKKFTIKQGPQTPNLRACQAWVLLSPSNPSPYSSLLSLHETQPLGFAISKDFRNPGSTGIQGGGGGWEEAPPSLLSLHVTEDD